MNCLLAREKMKDAFAAGLPLPQEILVHRENCPGCQAFYLRAENLFALLEAGLHGMVNRPVPTSLLPRVRAALDQAPVLRSFWVPGWRFAALASTVVLVVSLGVLAHYELRRDAVPQPTPLASLGAHQPATESLANAANPSTRGITPRNTASASHVQVPRPESEVIVSAEEREAFARYMVEQSTPKSMTVAVVPTAEADNQPIEIALLQIEDLEIKLLESMPAE